MKSTDTLVLDCTLRDGGYYTNWNFSSNFFEKYLNAVKSLPISYIELGYISDCKDNLGPFYHLDNKIIQYSKSKIRKDQKVLAMINFKEIRGANHLKKLIEKYGKNLDGIRFAVNPANILKFRALITTFKKSKYKNLDIYLNIMYLSDWYQNDKLIKKLFDNIPRNIKILAFVDSHGALEPNQVENFFNKIKLKFSLPYSFGCHFHNNCGLALANTIVAKKNNCSIIDTTFKGMGRGAGNAETELMLACDSEKRKNIKGFHLNNLLEELKTLKDKLDWGSSFAYAFAAKNGYSQASMMNLIQKRRLDPSTALTVIKERKDAAIKFSSIKKNIKSFITKAPPILVGGGESQKEFGKFIYNKISKNNVLVFSSLKSLYNFSQLEENLKNKKGLILSGNEFEKVKLGDLKSIISKNKINFCLIEEKFTSKGIKHIFGSNSIFSNSSALNPLYLFGSLLEKLNYRKMQMAFFDGNPLSDKDRIVMDETKNSFNHLKKRGMKLTSITKNFSPTIMSIFG
jgi:4-hydroxy 2-oxovalerate aldolase